ncbi:hypothetical protein FOVG_08159 [Fusarium oxysporum f. sp. pisi HDV247]|uniref:Uncharacterized protein n=1 Tax=Fusarium oxysporum f. sp. pisi HDV247 TaxID=1080344 RepID=W9PJC4_FUSOX|nr:hypothetical protein FOVG_08159 [Fusarium oxysporum f. sp. pisi HDV247]
MTKSMFERTKDKFARKNSSSSQAEWRLSRRDVRGVNDAGTSWNTNNPFLDPLSATQPSNDTRESDLKSPGALLDLPTINLLAKDAPPAYTASAGPSTSSSLASITSAEDKYAFLSTFDTVFLIDDSGVMAGRSWREVRDALLAITSICTSHDPDGVDIYSLNHKSGARGSATQAPNGYNNIRNPAGVQRLFESVRPSGATPTGNRLQSILNPGLKDYRVKAKVGEYEVDALPDTGAKYNFISQQFVAKGCLVPDNTTPEAIQLPCGKTVISPGTVKVPFVFQGEIKKYMLDCRILPGCTSDLVLSGSFLRATKTLTKFKNRIQGVLRKLKTCPRVSLLGNEEQRLWGRLNGHHVLALPDTGSDVMLVSAQWAKSNYLKVDYSPEHHLELEQGDGSKFSTMGCIHNATWTFGDSEQQTSWDFYVVNDLPVDVLFSNEFIFEFDLFSKFEHFMVDHEFSLGLPGFYNVRLISKYSPELARLEEESNNDLRSPSAVRVERVRRDRIRDTIDALDDPAEQIEARFKENQRQKQWDTRRKEHERQQKLAAIDPGQAAAQGEGHGQQSPKPKKHWWESNFFVREL